MVLLRSQDLGVWLSVSRTYIGDSHSTSSTSLSTTKDMDGPRRIGRGRGRGRGGGGSGGGGSNTPFTTRSGSAHSSSSDPSFTTCFGHIERTRAR